MLLCGAEHLDGMGLPIIITCEVPVHICASSRFLALIDQHATLQKTLSGSEEYHHVHTLHAWQLFTGRMYLA